MKRVTKINKVWACILALTLLVSVFGPMQTVRAEVNYANSGKISLHGNSSGQWSQPDYIWFTTTDTSLSVSGSTQMTAETGKVTRTRGSETTDVTTSVYLFCDTTAGLFHFILPGNAGMSAQDGDEITLQGKFKVGDTQGMNFEEVTFKYVGDGTANDSDDYWQIVKNIAYADSGEISLHGNSSGQWSQPDYIWFTTTDTSLSVSGSTQMTAETGKVTRTRGSETTDVTTSVYLFCDTTAGLFHFILPGNAGMSAQAGDEITLQGKFKVGDTQGMNFESVTFKYTGDGTANDADDYWQIVKNIAYADSGEISLHGNSSGQWSQPDYIWFTTTDTSLSVSGSTQMTAETGKVTRTRGSETTDVTTSVYLFCDTTAGLFHFILPGNAGMSAQNGDKITLQGRFTVGDTKGINFETVTFQYTGDGTANDSDDYWEIVKHIDYVDSGALSLHSNSSSPRATSGSYDGNVVLWFNTVDVTFPKHNGSRLVAKGGQLTVTKAATDETVDIYATGAAIMSQKEGLYGLWLMDVNKVSNGDMLTIQGQFAMSDGSTGIDFQPVTFKYIEESSKGYWITEGVTFTSGQYLKTEKPYTSEILAFEADIRLSANATDKGGVILGTDDGSGDAYTFGVDANGAPYLSLKDGSNEAVEYKFAGVNVCTSEWVNLVITRDKTNGKVSCYVDGESKGELSITNDAKILPTADAVVGGNDSQDNAQFFKGRIRTVKVYSDTSMTTLIARYDMSWIGANAKTVSDSSGNAYHLSYSLRWMDKAPTIGDYAYSFAVVGDTQTLNDSYKTEMSKVYKYITDNAASKNTKFVFGLGDITEWNGTHGLDEWQRAKDYITTLDTAGIPYSLCRGNHDGVLTNEGSTRMNEYFPYEKYKDKLSVYSEGKIENSYQYLALKDADYLIFTLDYNPSEDVLEWAGNIIEAHPYHNVIITTHSYISVNKQYTADGNGNGALIWEKLVKKYENVVLVLSGHVGTTYDIIWNQVTGDHGNTVTQMMVNPQWADAVTAGGTGMVAMLYFSEDGKNVQVEYYSTIRKQWLADTNQFTLELDVVEHIYPLSVSGIVDGSTYCGDVEFSVATANGSYENSLASVTVGGTTVSLVDGAYTIPAGAGSTTVVVTDKMGRIQEFDITVNVAHTWKSELVSNNDATCQADGTKSKQCSACQTMDTEKIPDLGSKTEHKFENYVSDGDATCGADGHETAECKYGCGKKDRRVAEGSATGKHTYGDGNKCTVCGKENAEQSQESTGRVDTGDINCIWTTFLIMMIAAAVVVILKGNKIKQ